MPNLPEEFEKRKPGIKEEYITTRTELLEASRKRQREAAETTKKKIFSARKKLEPRKAYDAEKALRAIILDDFVGPIEDAQKDWNEVLAEMDRRPFSEALADFNEELIQRTMPFEARMEEAAKFAEAYLRKMTFGAKGGKLTREVLLKMRDSTVKARHVAEILFNEENEGMQAALRWVLKIGAETEGGGERSVEANKPKAIAALKEELKKRSEETMPTLYVILNFMDPVDKVKLIKEHILEERLTQDKAKKFLETGNCMGAFSPAEMREIMESAYGEEFKGFEPDEIKKYACAYKIQHDFIKQAARLKPTYGAKNAAGERITLKNIGIFVGQLAALATLGGNIIASSFYGGAYKRPSEALRKILQNEYVWASGGFLVFSKAIKGEKALSDYLKGKEERDKEDIASSQKDIFTGISKNPGWARFFEDNNHEGAKALAQYIGRKNMYKKEKLRPEKLKISEFIKWMQFQSKDPKKTAKYERLLGKFKDLGGGEFKISTAEGVSFETTDVDFKRFAEAFLILGIGGAEVERNYANTIKSAKGAV